MSAFKLFIIYITFISTSIFSQSSLAGFTAEEILGEYWKDPLFGEAAANTTISLELLPGMIWPNKVTVPLSKNVRFVFINKSEEMVTAKEQITTAITFQEEAANEMFGTEFFDIPAGSKWGNKTYSTIYKEFFNRHKSATWTLIGALLKLCANRRISSKNSSVNSSPNILVIGSF